MIYIIHILVILFLFFTSKVVFRNNGFFIKSSFVYSILIFGQRWMVGTDYGNYLSYYIYNYQGTEIGYRTLQNLFVEYGLSFSLFTFLLYLITQLNFYRFMTKFKKNAAWIIFFYCLSEIFFAETSQIRQWLAISFFLNGYYYMYYKRYIKVVAYVFLGLLFHQSILLVIPFLFLRFNSVLKSKKVLLTLILILIILPAIDLKILLPYFSNNSLVNSYIDSPYIVGLSKLHILKYYFLVVCTYVFISKVNYSNERLFSMMLNGQIIYLILYGLSIQMGAFMRFSFYFKIFEIVFFVCLISALKGFNKKQVSIAFIIYYLFLYISISLLDTVELSYFQMRLVTIFEPYSHLELINEIEEFLFKVGR